MAIAWHTTLPFVAQNTTGTTVLVSGALNQSGYIYSVIVPAASGVPSSANIAAGNDASGNALGAGFKDNEAVAASGTWASLSGYGLTSETSYKMYLVGSGYTDGLMASGWGVAFTTYDESAPNWSVGYPYEDSNTGTTARFLFAIADDDNCSGWGLNLASGAAVPTAAAIKASGLGVFMRTHETISAEVTFSGLTSETTYDAYFVAQNASAVLQSSGYLVRYTTDDITAPAWTSGWPNVSSVTTSTASVNLKLNDAGSGYFVIIPSGNSTPNASQIIAHTDADDTAIAAGLYGSGTLVANTEKTLSATSLKYSTYYTVCVTAKDEAFNPTAAVATYSFRTSVPAPGAPSNFYSAKNAAERRRKGMVRGTLSL